MADDQDDVDGIRPKVVRSVWSWGKFHRFQTRPHRRDGVILEVGENLRAVLFATGRHCGSKVGERQLSDRITESR